MSKVALKIKYSEDELSAILIALRGYLKENQQPESTLDALCNVIIHNLTIRIAKRLLEQKYKYKFGFSQEESLAFIFIYEERISYLPDIWTANILHITFNHLHKHLA